MFQEQALRERMDAALSRLRNGTAVYLSHSEVEKRMALFKAKIWGSYRWGGVAQGCAGRFVWIEQNVSWC